MSNLMMMWYDANPKSSLMEKIDTAVLYFHRKYKEFPTVCLVNSKALDINTKMPKKIAIRIDQYVLPNHLLLGVERKK